MFQWDDIRIFLAIVRKSSLPEAAKELGISHSTVFRRLNSFEKSIGVRLFDRASTGFILTAAGESILEMARDMELEAGEHAAWMMLCHLILNLDEVVTKG